MDKTGSTKPLFLGLFTAACLLGAEASGGSFARNDHPVLVTETDQIFPHLAIGGGWETILVIVNMSRTNTISWTQEFYDTNGSPLPVTYKTIPDGFTETSSSTRGTLDPEAGFNILLTGGDSVRTGWSGIRYDTSQGRLGGYVTFRQRTSRGALEAFVPLSSYSDFRFYLPVDNLEGFNTAIAIANPFDRNTRVRLTMLAQNGTAAGDSTEISLPPYGQTSFVVADRVREAAGRIGTLFVEADTDNLSAIGLRFNPDGAFSSLPVLNWPAMLQ